MSRKRAKKLVRATTRSVGPIDKYFGDRLRARRIMMKMSQEDLGKSLGVSFQQIQKYEKGVNRIGSARLIRIADALETGMDYFVGDNGNSQPMPLSQFLATRDGIDIVEAMMKLDNPILRRSVIDLTRKLSSAYGG